MRNIFDQYSQPENRITHAFLTALHEDRQLLGKFLRDIVKVAPPVKANQLRLLEQQFPGEEEKDEGDAERKGIPDGWIFDEESGWCVLIESKVLAKFDLDQIRRHRRIAEKRGFREVHVVAITPRNEARRPSDATMLEWREIYIWLKRQSLQSEWAARVAQYFEVAESKLVDSGQFREGALTMFAGIPFDAEHPYSYVEAKRVLSLALAELRQRQDLREVLGMNPQAQGRPAITGKGDGRVWDFLSLAASSSDEAFTHHPHLTLNITDTSLEAMITIPHGVNTAMRRSLTSLGEEGFKAIVSEIVENLTGLLKANAGASPRFRGVQRRYPSQRSQPFLDAMVDFDLRTSVSDSGPPKMQPVWLAAGYGALVNKEGANYQVQVGVSFPYDLCPAIREPVALDLIARSWLACQPIIAPLQAS